MDYPIRKFLLQFVLQYGLQVKSEHELTQTGLFYFHFKIRDLEESKDFCLRHNSNHLTVAPPRGPSEICLCLTHHFKVSRRNNQVVDDVIDLRD